MRRLRDSIPCIAPHSIACIARHSIACIALLLASAPLCAETPSSTAATPPATTAPVAHPAHERVIPLEHGSNFRDIGGYATRDGHHVRWGMIYRSAATPDLTAADIAKINALGLNDLIDLRSDEERVFAPTKLDGIPTTSVGYSMNALMTPGGGFNLQAIYRQFPSFLAPQLKVVFHDLANGHSRIAYNCSAGQDRTGFVTAMVLSALGVPRETIYQDYLLSTGYRHPEYELPPIGPEMAASNSVAAYFAKAQKDPRFTTPNPLYGADKVPYLKTAFDEIDRKWGSVDAYLRDEIGLDGQDIRALRKAYLN